MFPLINLIKLERLPEYFTKIKIISKKIDLNEQNRNSKFFKLMRKENLISVKDFGLGKKYD